jgi:hypothetical protein
MTRRSVSVHRIRTSEADAFIIGVKKVRFDPLFIVLLTREFDASYMFAAEKLFMYN